MGGGPPACSILSDRGRTVRPGAAAADPQPPNALRAALSLLELESSAQVVPSWLTQMAAFSRGNLLHIAAAASMIHCPLVTPAGSPAPRSALPYSASIIGLEALSEATRE